MRKEIEGEERRGILVLFFLGEKEKERTIFERLNREYLFVMGPNISLRFSESCLKIIQ